MLNIFGKRDWPAMPFEEIKKRSKILVIDDSDFAYLPLFEKDGYTVEKWDDIVDLPRLESGYYDLILLDIQGVGRDRSAEQGLGILRHLHAVNPAQIVIAYSNADWSLKYQEFFALANATLAKSGDYVEFKRTVDRLLKDRFSLAYYLQKIEALVGDDIPNRDKLRTLAQKAILNGRTETLELFLRKSSDRAEITSLVIQTAKFAIKLGSALL